MHKSIAITLAMVSPLIFSAEVAAQTTVECRSRDYKYSECSASGLSRPQLIHQISSSSCILNRTWGYNPRSGYIWVSEGCAATFADVSGYHHGRGDTYDEGARRYDDKGRDAGLVIGGLLLGALVEGAVSSDSHHKKRSDSGYNGCHGTGCLVDDPDAPPEPGQTDMR